MPWEQEERDTTHRKGVLNPLAWGRMEPRWHIHSGSVANEGEYILSQIEGLKYI